MSRRNLSAFVAATGLVVALMIGQSTAQAAGAVYVSTKGSDANDCLSPRTACATINAAIGKATAGDTIYIEPGRYAENVVVNKPVTLAGDEEGTTIVPAVSDPDCTGGSLCGGAASNIILVQADNVTIHDLQLDGSNPSLAGGVVVGGAKINARNGIITNHLASVVYNSLVVHDVSIKNVYLRGMYASSGGTFNFHDNEVKNVQGDPASIAMFDFGGAGIFENNRVSDANDAISANWSTGSKFLNNHVSRSGSGVHTDNNGGFGGAGDVIRGNEIKDCTTGGYGIFVFVPYQAVTVSDNDISNCSVGLAAYGQVGAVVTTFADNSVHGMKGSTGAFVTDDQLGFGAANVSAVFSGNDFSHNAVGLDLEQTVPPNVVTVTLHQNNIKNNDTGLKNNSGQATDATNNWWGCANGPGAPGCDTIVNVGTSTTNFVPFLTKPTR
jgi:hypothetical protein